MISNEQRLAWALQRLAQQQGGNLDPLRLSASLTGMGDEDDPMQWLRAVCKSMGLNKPKTLRFPDRAHLPLLCHVESLGWGVVVDRKPNGDWVVATSEGNTEASQESMENRVAILRLGRTRNSEFGAGESGSAGGALSFISQVREAFRIFKGDLVEACVASAFIGILALATSLYSMQVYDRVIPTRSEYTLVILSLGVLLSILIELGMKYARSNIMDHVIVGVDARLSREIFHRLMQLRVDQIPASVGSLAGQLRGYEQVRGFYTASTLFTLIDIPLAIVFTIIILLITSIWVALVPVVFGIAAMYIGFSIRQAIMLQAKEGAALSNMKTGLLVEAVEGIETIKAGSGGWKFLSRWIGVNGMTIQNDLRMRNATESVGYLSATIQQASYAGLVVVGSIVVMQGNMTMGALIASSILSGRILAPIMAIPGLLVQHAHAKAALEGLENIYKLKVDYHGTDSPLSPSILTGRYQLVEAKFSYGDNPPALSIPKLEILPGERVAILGPIGAGKSTLLRLLSGLYHPQAGRVLLDDLDIAHVDRHVINQYIGYLQQDHRLFQGTVRENLLIGLPDPGDDALLAAIKRTGMDRFVAAHPKGLERQIAEGGKGLSGGQKQLLAFTRLMLCNPSVLLLDEPTASMDDEQERRCLSVLSQEAQANKTLIIVTHKPSILPLINRIIVVAGSSIVLDGPRDMVLQHLQQNKSREVAPLV